MARKTIKINLFDGGKSLQQAIRQIEQYKNDLPKKCEEYVRRLAELGIPVIDSNIAAAQGDSDKTHNTYIKINSFGSYSQAELIVEGQGILFVEFGAGVYWNGEAKHSPHPLGEEMGYTIGSYGQGKGKQNTWGYYAEGGELVLTHGTQATMPVYKAGLEIRKQMLGIAKEVFG